MSDTVFEQSGGLVIELDAFDGPLDLLLYLIKREEIDIYDIPIAEITRQYLGYLEACQELNLEIAGEFVYMAALLIRIKTQMLLPRPEDQEQWDDPRTELVNALLEYRKVKKISASLEEQAALMQKRYTRIYFSGQDLPAPEPELLKVDLTSLMIAFGDLMRRVGTEPTIEIRPLAITVASRKEHILSLFQDRSSLEFEELFSDDPRKIVMVITFVALLDLVKNGELIFEQAEHFSSIRVFRRVERPLVSEN